MVHTNSYLLETCDNVFHSATTRSWKSPVPTGNAWGFSVYCPVLDTYISLIFDALG